MSSSEGELIIDWSDDDKQNQAAKTTGDEKECFNCQAINTSLWRRDEEGNRICNACQNYFKKHQVKRPSSMRKDIVRKRKRKSSKGKENSKDDSQCLLPEPPGASCSYKASPLLKQFGDDIERNEQACESEKARYINVLTGAKAQPLPSIMAKGWRDGSFFTSVPASKSSCSTTEQNSHLSSPLIARKRSGDDEEISKTKKDINIPINAQSSNKSVPGDMEKTKKK